MAMMPPFAPGTIPFESDLMLARELGTTLDAVLGMPPRERHMLWPRFLRSHPATLGETRIVWMLGRIAALVYNAWRGKGDKALDARDFVRGLVPIPRPPKGPDGQPDAPTGSYWESAMLGIVDRLRAEHAAQQAAEGGDDG